MDWGDVSWATGYKVSNGTTEGGTEIANLVDCEDSMWSGDTEWILDTTYYWKVYTMNDDQMVEGYSWSFSTDDPTVTPPFFDGFETNNVNTMPVNAWTQEAVVEVDVGYYWMGLNEYEEGMMYPRTGEWLLPHLLVETGCSNPWILALTTLTG